MIGTVEIEMREVEAEAVSGILREFEDVVRNRGINVTAARWRVEEEPPKEVPKPPEPGVGESGEEKE